MRVGLTTARLEALAQFYQQAFGCRPLGRESLKARDSAALYGVRSGTERLLLGLGGQCIELLQFDKSGEDYPLDEVASDLSFQHISIVVRDMAAAYAHLAQLTGWMAISSTGPQQLPESSGGASAFKFRDPEGHPLQLLAFARGRAPRAWSHPAAEGLFLGIDHAGLSVADSARSIAFYEALGLEVGTQTLNRGPQQARLDDLLMPAVEVTALLPEQGITHLELQCYRAAAHARSSRIADNDIAATRLIFEAPAGVARSSPGRSIADPDGHRLVLLHPETCPAAGAQKG